MEDCTCASALLLLHLCYWLLEQHRPRHFLNVLRHSSIFVCISLRNIFNVCGQEKRGRSQLTSRLPRKQPLASYFFDLVERMIQLVILISLSLGALSTLPISEYVAVSYLQLTISLAQLQCHDCLYHIACPAWKPFNSCGSPCPLTCDNYQDGSTCDTTFCEGGCFCPDGEVEFGDFCRSPSDCPSGEGVSNPPTPPTLPPGKLLAQLDF